MRSFSTDQFGQRSHEKFICSKRVSKSLVLIFMEFVKHIRNGLRTEISGSGYLESARNFDPNPMAMVPDPKIRVLFVFVWRWGGVYKNSRSTAPGGNYVSISSPR